VNDRQRIQIALVAAERLAMLGRTLDTIGPDGRTVTARMRDSQGPLRGRSHEAPVRGANGSGPGSTAGDRALADERELDAQLAALGRCVGRLWRVVDGYGPPHFATASERKLLGLADETWCSSCLRVEGSDGRPRREPVAARPAGPTDVGGRLAEPQNLCQWCYRCVLDWGRLPNPEELQRHHSGQRVPWPSDVPRPA
jgi:hypothetical protein